MRGLFLAALASGCAGDPPPFLTPVYDDDAAVCPAQLDDAVLGCPCPAGRQTCADWQPLTCTDGRWAPLAGANCSGPMQLGPEQCFAPGHHTDVLFAERGCRCPTEGEEVCEDGAGYRCMNGAWARAPTACDFLRCAPQQAAMTDSAAPCEQQQRWIWAGAGCGQVAGCECVGADCGKLFTSQQACEDAFPSCAGVGKPCGGFAGNTCSASEYCAYTGNRECSVLGDASGLCQPRPTQCSGPVGAVCGCDLKTYDSACHAALAGQGVFFAGVCK